MQRVSIIHNALRLLSLGKMESINAVNIIAFRCPYYYSLALYVIDHLTPK